MIDYQTHTIQYQRFERSKEMKQVDHSIKPSVSRGLMKPRAKQFQRMSPSFSFEEESLKSPAEIVPRFCIRFHREIRTEDGQTQQSGILEKAACIMFIKMMERILTHCLYHNYAFIMKSRPRAESRSNSRKREH